MCVHTTDHKYVQNLNILYKKLVLFQMENYSIKMDIVRYYLLPNSTVLRLCNEKDEYVTVQK